MDGETRPFCYRTTQIVAPFLKPTFVSMIGLRYAAIDMRTNKKGEHYFLEINPIAQYLFVEVVTNQPITRTLARLLADPVKSK
jgi:hypothetical protein